MKENLIVSPKGQITLPAAMRKALGLVGSAVVTVEQQGGRIVLTPAMVVETEVFSDEDVAAWSGDDQFVGSEREALERRIGVGKRNPGARR